MFAASFKAIIEIASNFYWDYVKSLGFSMFLPIMVSKILTARWKVDFEIFLT
jgi:hypothetical protein